MKNRRTRRKTFGAKGKSTTNSAHMASPPETLIVGDPGGVPRS